MMNDVGWKKQFPTKKKVGLSIRSYKFFFFYFFFDDVLLFKLLKYIFLYKL